MDKIKEKLKSLSNENICKVNLFKKNDELILFIHCINLQNLNCVGLQEDDMENMKELPQNWNQIEQSIYSFKYRTKKDNKLYFFKLIIEGKTLDINILDPNNNNKIHSIELSSDALINEELYTTYEKQLNKIIENEKKKEIFASSLFNMPLNNIYQPPQRSPLQIPGQNNPYAVRYDPVFPFGDGNPDNDMDPFEIPGQNPFNMPRNMQNSIIQDPLNPFQHGPLQNNPLQGPNQILRPPFGNKRGGPNFGGGFQGGFGGGYGGGFM